MGSGNGTAVSGGGFGAGGGGIGTSSARHADEFCYHNPRKVAEEAAQEQCDLVAWHSLHFHPHFADLADRRRLPVTQPDDILSHPQAEGLTIRGDRKRPYADKTAILRRV